MNLIRSISKWKFSVCVCVCDDAWQKQKCARCWSSTSYAFNTWALNKLPRIVKIEFHSTHCSVIHQSNDDEGHVEHTLTSLLLRCCPIFFSTTALLSNLSSSYEMNVISKRAKQIVWTCVTTLKMANMMIANIWSNKSVWHLIVAIFGLQENTVKTNFHSSTSLRL